MKRNTGNREEVGKGNGKGTEKKAEKEIGKKAGKEIGEKTWKSTPLYLIEPGKNTKISHLETEDLNILQKLMAMGILPGMPVTLIRKSPSYVFEMDQTRYAVDRDIAARIYVSC